MIQEGLNLQSLVDNKCGRHWLPVQLSHRVCTCRPLLYKNLNRIRSNGGRTWGGGSSRIRKRDIKSGEVVRRHGFLGLSNPLARREMFSGGQARPGQKPAKFSGFGCCFIWRLYL